MREVEFGGLVVLVVFLVVEVVDLVELTGDFGVFLGGFLAGVLEVFFVGDLVTDSTGAFA